MSWNYRVVSQKWGKKDTLYGVHEVYYKDDEPHMITVRPIKLSADTVEELRADIALIQDAFTKPVLEYEWFSTKCGR